MPPCREGLAQSWKPEDALLARYWPWADELCLSAGLAWAQACANSVILLGHHSSGGAGNAICTSHCEGVLDALQGGELFCQVARYHGLRDVPSRCDISSFCGSPHNFCWVLLQCYVFLGAHNTWKLSPVSQKERIRSINLFFMFTRKLEMSKIFSWLLEWDSAPD